MKASTFVLLASSVSAGSLNARWDRHSDDDTTTITVTAPQSTTTKTITVTAKCSSSTDISTTISSKILSTTTQKSTTTVKITTTTSTSAPKLSTTTTTTSTTTPKISTTTTPQEPNTAATNATTTTLTTTSSTRTSKQAAPTATSCEEIGDGNIHTAPNGEKWHVQCNQHYTGSNSIIGFSDSVDDLSECLDYCSTVSGARVVQYSDSYCECWAHGGTGIESSEGSDAAYTLEDNS